MSFEELTPRQMQNQITDLEIQVEKLREALTRIRDHRWESRAYAYADEAYCEVQTIADEALKP